MFVLLDKPKPRYQIIIFYFNLKINSSWLPLLISKTIWYTFGFSLLKINNSFQNPMRKILAEIFMAKIKIVSLLIFPHIFLGWTSTLAKSWIPSNSRLETCAWSLEAVTLDVLEPSCTGKDILVLSILCTLR